MAQNQINMVIHHQMNGEALEFNTVTDNNLGQSFFLDRMQYYVSGFSVIHDGGTETVFEDIYALITAGSEATTTVDLGLHDINTIEKVLFHIGVDEPKNHLDPTAYPADHPLAPKVPSMHWGWAGGYRFIALEGLSGPDTNQELQMHCIGDNNYQLVEVELTSEAENNVVAIEIAADYANALRDIVIKDGLIQHGDLNEIVTLVANFGTHVFTDLNASPSKIDLTWDVEWNVFPNPSTSNVVFIETEGLQSEATITVYDVAGKIVWEQVVQKSRTEITGLNQGQYFVQLSNTNSGANSVKKLNVISK